MALIPFPNIPKLPGVPNLPRSPNFPPTVRSILGVLQSYLWRSFQVGTNWGIFDSKGKQLGDSSKIASGFEAVGLRATLSTHAVEYSKETRVSDYPIEAGSFASYNKVETPGNPTVTLAYQGNEQERRAFLDAIDKATLSTELYSVVTPEVTYVNCSIERYNYQRRSEKGATLLVVELSLKEIRQVSATYSQVEVGKMTAPKPVSAKPASDAGKIQAKTPRTSTLKSLEKFIKGVIN